MCYPNWLRRIVAGGLVSVLVLGVAGCVGGDPSSSPTSSQVSKSPAESPKSSSISDPVTPSESPKASADYGPLPPKNKDALKSLQPTKFPPKVGSYTLKKADVENIGGATASYKDEAKYTGFIASVDYGIQPYKITVDGMADPKYYGNPVCGLDENQIRSCVMAGKGEALSLIVSNREITLEQVAALTQELYDSL